jgi:hypothetical protein
VEQAVTEIVKLFQGGRDDCNINDNAVWRYFRGSGIRHVVLFKHVLKRRKGDGNMDS